jgi:zinc transport system ATP-binding protein
MLHLLEPSSGSVRLFGTDIGDFTDWPKIGYVPQKAASFDINFPVTVAEVVVMGRFGRRGLFRRVTNDDRARAQQALAHVEMSKFSHRLIGDLSGGQQQRVFMARALAAEPEIIFLDEPTVGVEQHIRNEFYALLTKLNHDLHLTVVLITHDLDTMAHEAMHVACMDRTLYYHESAEAFLRETRAVDHSHDSHV